MHKHHDMIVAWAKGATIQRYNKTLQQWRECDSTMLDWNPDTAYRIKPVPRPDLIFYITVSNCKKWEGVPRMDSWNCFEALSTDNLMLVFDGETGVLKSAEVINEN